MATSNRSTTSILGILAIVVVVGVALYFILNRNDDGIDIDIGLGHDASPGWVAA